MKAFLGTDSDRWHAPNSMTAGDGDKQSDAQGAWRGAAMHGAISVNTFHDSG